MTEQWILNKIERHRHAPLIILRDPQRLIQRGAHVVDGWAEQNGFSVVFCVGNLALREMYEAMRDDPEARVLVVDRSRAEAKIPLFYPDLQAQARAGCQMTLSLRELLVDKTGDSHWPALVDERDLSRLIVANLPEVLRAHEQLRQVSPERFTDSDLYKVVLGAVLHINPFRQLTAAEVRRLCVEQHQAIESVRGVLPADVTDALRDTVARAPKPFCWLLERDPKLIVRAFTLAAIMHQHGLEYQILLSNLDPALAEYREIDPLFLSQATEELLAADPDQVLADVADAEGFLLDEPSRLAFLLHDRLHIEEPQRALEVLKAERLSAVVRGLALASLLADLILSKDLKNHAQVLDLLDSQAGATDLPLLRRPTEQSQALEATYRRALELYGLTARLARTAKKLQVAATAELIFDAFDKLWNKDRLNRLDYYTSDLQRRLRVADILPVPARTLWPEIEARWESARAELAGTAEAVVEVQNLIDTRFQDLYLAKYTDWIRRDDAPAVFTHQFLPRLLKAHWDPKSGRKAVVMVFDGMRTDAWDEFLRPVFEERFEVVDSRPGSALIPTETHLSRKAISAGCLPDAFSSTNELKLLRAWLKDKLGLEPNFVDIKDDDTVASGMTVRYVSDRMEYIVFNFTDKNLHSNPQDLAFIYETTVREIIRQDVRSVLRELPDDALIFVTADHGFCPVPKDTVTVPDDIVVDARDVTYRCALTTGKMPDADAKRVIVFEARALGVPQKSATVAGAAIQHVVFPRPGLTLRRAKGQRDPDPYSHGGLSLAECMVPMVVLGPKRKEQPVLAIEKVAQVGSVSEGEELTLEITVVPMRIAQPDLSITLSFTREGIPTRREVFRGVRATYTVRWQPKLGDMSDSDRQRGAVVQPVTVILSYSDGKQTVRLSKTADVRVKLDPSRLRRRVDTTLDLLMGKVPKGLQS